MDERPATQPVPAKVLGPDTSSLEPRSALLRHLDPAGGRAVVWIDGPPGTGKTSLAAQGMAAFAGARLWVRIDPGDADAGDFFHFLHCAAVAAGLDAARLPRLSAEYAADSTAFARRFLHACSELGDWCLVLDNLDVVLPGTPPHALVTAARESRTAGSLLVVTSRNEPGGELARLRVEGALERLSADELRLTREEALTLARRANVDWTPEAVERARERSRGWVAGFRLMLSFAQEDAPSATPESPTPHVLLDYLAREFLDHLPPATVELIGLLAPLESVPRECVEALAGADGIDGLDGLVRRHAFVAREGTSGGERYRLDPLLCECLDARRAQTVSAEERRRDHARVAEALSASGDTERAVDMWLAAGHHERAAEILRSLAPSQLKTGRFATVRRRLAALPEPLRAGDPWLRLCYATATIPVAPAAARAELLRAYREFRTASVREGAALAWAGTAESLWVEWGDYDSVAWLLDELEWLAAGEISSTARARLAPQAVLLLGILRPQARASLEGWIEVARRTPANPEVGAAEQLTILHTLLAIDVWLRGAREHGDNLLAQGRRLEAIAVLPPLQRLMWRGAAASHRLWFADDPLETIAEAETGLALARDTGVHQWDFQLNALAACGAIAAGETEQASEWLAAIEASGQPDRPADASFHAWIAGWAAIRRGDTVTALARARKAMDDLGAGGPWNAVHIVHLALAQAERVAGNPQTALQHARTVALAARSAGAGIHRWLAALFRVHLLLDAGQARRARRLLRATLADGARRGYLRLAWWPPSAIATLCGEAVNAGVPPGYVRRLAASNGLQEWHPRGAADTWPWPVRVRALGELRVHADGESRDLAGKGAALLQMLVTESVDSVDQERVTDLLWPDVEGDRARRSLDTTLHRLRQRLGRPDAIRMHAGRIDLDPAVVWTDLRALGEHLNAAGAGSDTAWRDLRALLGDIRGPAAEWAGTAAQRVRQRLCRAAEQEVITQMEAGRAGAAMDTAEAVLAVDGTAERLCRLGLQAAQRADDPGGADRIYAICRAALAIHHAAAPSPRTEALHREIVDDPRARPGRV